MLTKHGHHFALYMYIKLLGCILWPNTMLYVNYISKEVGGGRILMLRPTVTPKVRDLIIFPL